MALSVLAVALGVAFVVGALVFSNTINATFTGLLTANAADITVTPQAAFPVEVEDQAISGVTPTLPAQTLTQIAALPGVAAAHGEVMVQNLTVIDHTNTAVGPTRRAGQTGGGSAELGVSTGGRGTARRY